MLMSDSYLSPIQAVSCLGAAVHMDVARVLVRHLRNRGLLSPGVRYGSACSGVWTARLRARSKRSYANLSTCSPARLMLPRGAPFSGHGTPSGLPAPACTSTPPVIQLSRPPLWGVGFVPTPCGAFSPRNHARSLKAQTEHSGQISRMLDYICLAQRPPSVVVVENLPGLDAVGAIDGL